MENRQRWVNISYAAAGGLLWFIVNQLLLQVAASTDLESKVTHLEYWVMGLSIASGFGLFLGLYWSHKTNQYMNEVVVELSRVTWPQKQESVRNTYLVIIGVAFAGFVLGVMDLIWTKVVQGLFQVLPGLLSWMR